MKITAKEIKKVKAIAEKNFIDSMELDIDTSGMVSFEFNGMNIINPWIDESGRFDLSDEKAIETYGLENVLNFIINTLRRYR